MQESPQALFLEKDGITKLRRKVKALQKRPQSIQRTPEWFKQRQTRITASEAASCLYKSEKVCKPYVEDFKLENFKYKDTEPLNPYETREEYIIKKCSAFFGESVFKDNPYTLWGKKYEDVANRLYKKIKGVNVLEFGLVPHSRIKWLAASPDGITEDGIMVEIKCPKSRKIDTKAPPLYYWIQCQIQLYVCDLEHCDFLECEINEIDNEDVFKDIQLQENQDYGIILQFDGEEMTGKEPKFIYPPLELHSSVDYIEWKNKVIAESDQSLRPIYFHITKYNIMRIARNREWFESVKSDIKSTWDLVRKLQNNPEDFAKYKESIYQLKNKDYINKWNKTECLIHEEDTDFVLALERSSESANIEDQDMCMIESTE